MFIIFWSLSYCSIFDSLSWSNSCFPLHDRLQTCLASKLVELHGSVARLQRQCASAAEKAGALTVAREQAILARSDVEAEAGSQSNKSWGVATRHLYALVLIDSFQIICFSYLCILCISASWILFNSHFFAFYYLNGSAYFCHSIGNTCCSVGSEMSCWLTSALADLSGGR